MELNIRQKKAVNGNENRILCLAAGGSGKTRVLSERVIRLINEGIEPSKIVCITFTRMAAEEMRKRFGDKGQGMFIGTIHSYANYLCIKNGIDTNSLIEMQKFDKILEKALTLPQHCYDEVEHLLVDEFQDVSSLEFRFMDKIPSNNVFLIADNRQGIYQFKGATDAYLKMLHSDVNWTKYYLTENYRCAPNIIKYADNLIASLPKLSPAQIPHKTKDGIVEECSFNDAIEELEWSGDWGSWFILCRTNEEVSIAQDKLISKHIPCVTFKKADLDLEEMEGLLKENKVKVLTIHIAKGLESPKVIVVGAKTWSEDERKIAYVAATRAEQALYWCPSIRPKKSQSKYRNDFTEKNMGRFSNVSKGMISFEK